jgi:hypothetical protein
MRFGENILKPERQWNGCFGALTVLNKFGLLLEAWTGKQAQIFYFAVSFPF